MPQLSLFFGVLFTICIAAQTARAAAPEAGGEPKSMAARDALTTYAGAAAKAAREYHDKLVAARKQCIFALNGAKDDATKAANLDEAIRIRDTIARLQAEGAQAASAPPKAPMPTGREKLAARLAGTVWDAAGKPYRFNADGTMTVGAPNGATWQWAAIGDHDVVVRRADGWTECYTFDEELKSYSTTEYGNGTKRRTVKRAQ